MVRFVGALTQYVALSVILSDSINAQTPDLRKDAVAVWKFDEAAGESLRDASGNGHHGNIVGATWVKGSWGHALRFDRDNRNYIRIPDSPQLHVQPPYTFGVWLRTTSTQNNALYLLKNGGAFTGCGIYYYGDSKAMYVDAKGVDNKLYHKGNSSKSFPDGTWHHAVATCGNGKQRLFVDGQVFAERDVPDDLKLDYSGTKGVLLGHWQGNGYFDGTMGKAFILKRALTSDEVRALFDAERQKFNNDLTIQKTAKKPKIDGRLDDACWKDQPALDYFLRNDYDSTWAEHQTIARLSYDDENLFVAAECQVAERRKPPGSTTPDGLRRAAKTEDDDQLELFISAENGSYYHFVLTPANELHDRKCNYEIEQSGFAPGGFSKFAADDSWKCGGIHTAVQRGQRSWTAEMAIPLSKLGRTTSGTRWRLNIARSNKRSKEISTFTPLFQHLDQPDAFSSLTFGRDAAVLTRAAKKYTSVDVTPRAETNYDIKSNGEPIIFSNSYLRRGSYTTLPVGNRPTSSIDLFASLGEFEPATFSVRATGRQLDDVRATIAGDLKSDGGDVIPAANVEIRVVELWRRQMNSRQHMFMERFLEKQSSLDIPRHTTRRFWLTLHIPEQAKAGKYQSRIRIAAGEETLKLLDLQVEVLPIRLQQAAGMGYFMYLPTWGIPPKLRTESYLKEIFVDMRRHGMTTVTLYPYGLSFANVMNVLRDSKLMTSGVPAIWLGADAVGPERWKAVLDEAKKKKWPELALYLQDEPGNQERINNAKRLFAILDRFKQQYPEYKRVRATTAIGSTGIEALGSHYDIWIAGAGFNEELVKKSQAMDKLLWSYDCNLAPVDAESCRHYFGLWCWKTGIKGCALWAYADPGSTSSDAWEPILKDVENTELHYSFVRPMPDDLVPTIGWEAVREGVDDHRYLATLANLIAKAKAAGLTADAKRAQRVLADVTDKIDVNGYQMGIQGGNATKRRLGNHYDRIPPQANIAKGDYDRLRRRIANEILRLDRVLPSR